jgi:hypothetical protein
MFRAPLARAIGGVALAMAGACTVPDIDLAGRRCPCTGGFTCDSKRNVCVVEGSLGGGDGGSSFSCAAHPGALFCVDFDEPASATSPFGFVSVTGSAVAVADNTTAVSPPNSLSCVADGDAGPSGVLVLADVAGPVNYTRLHYALDLWLEPSPDTTDTAYLFGFDFVDNSGLSFASYSGSYTRLLWRNTDSSEVPVNQFDPLPPRAWVHVELVVDNSQTASPTVSVVFSAASAVPPVPLKAAPAASGVWVGVEPANGPGWTARFDNVIVWVE